MATVHVIPAERRGPIAPSDRLEFETLVSDTSARMIAAQPGFVEPAIEAALTDVRRFFHADRSLLLTVSEDYRVVNVGYASYADGVARMAGDVNLVQLFPWSRRLLFDDRVPVIVRRMADLPPEAAVDVASWNQYVPMRSNLAVPIQLAAVVSHVMVIHWVHRECRIPDAYVPRLRLLGETMVNALQRKTAFDALQASEERLDRAAAAGGCGLWELDFPSGRIWTTSETQRMYGLAPGEPPTWERFLGLLHPDDRETVVASVSSVLDGDGVFDERYRIVRDDGAVRWMHGTARSDTSGRLVGASVDVTESMVREAELRAALDEIGKLRDRLAQENMILRRDTKRAPGADLVVGRSPAIRAALALADQVAATGSTVLLLGETGTGKERFAEYIHQASPRRAQPMVRVNCSAIPTALIESELFGRERGAYTGALTRQVGRFELAHGSTIFLDEIGDLPLEMQAKLLRVLQDRTLERLGSPRPITVDVRVVVATNRNVEEAVREGTFRADLYYRLNVFPIVVPPLRDRREDIPALVNTLVEELGRAMGKRFDSIAKASVEALEAYSWPGNVRELRNLLERAMILSSGPVLTVDLPEVSAAGRAMAAARTAAAGLHEVERAHILRILEDTGWRIRGKNGAAEVLGLKPTTLEGRMAKLGIRRPRCPRQP